MIENKGHEPDPDNDNNNHEKKPTLQTSEGRLTVEEIRSRQETGEADNLTVYIEPPSGTDLSRFD